MDLIWSAADYSGRRRGALSILRISRRIVITGEASYHAAYDHCTAKYLTQAGVKVTALRLGHHGIHGNGHMIMLEKNNLQVAGLIAAWLARTIPAR